MLIFILPDVRIWLFSVLYNSKFNILVLQTQHSRTSCHLFFLNLTRFKTEMIHILCLNTVSSLPHNENDQYFQCHHLHWLQTLSSEVPGRRLYLLSEQQRRAVKLASKAGNRIGFCKWWCVCVYLCVFVGVCILRSQRDRATQHFNIPNNVGETGHLFENPTSNETACQQRVMHIFPPAPRIQQEQAGAQGELTSARRYTFDQDYKVGDGRSQTDRIYTSKYVDSESIQLQRNLANQLPYQGLASCTRSAVV